MQHGAPEIGKLGLLIVHSDVRFTGLTALQTVTQRPVLGARLVPNPVYRKYERPLHIRRYNQLQCAII